MTAPRTGARAELGFGCASLGSRVGRADGLRALSRAFERGICWFDVAPSYGDGGAEDILGEFSATLGDQVRICTKVGLAPPPASALRAAIKPIARSVVAAFPGLRKMVSRSRPAPQRPPLTPQLITASAEASLRRLRRDRLDVLALHDASPDDVLRDDVLHELSRLREVGKVREIAVASSADAAIAAVQGACQVFGVLQIPNNAYARNVSRIRRIAGVLPSVRLIGHSAFEPFGARARLIADIGTRAPLCLALKEAGYAGDSGEIASAFLADYALVSNAGGIVLMSMFDPRHLEFNLARVSVDRSREAEMRILEIAQSLEEAPP